MELFRALATLAESPRAESARVAEALGLGAPPGADEHTQIFVFQLYPYASVYLGAEGMLGGEARDRVAGFWRALGQAPPAEADHVSVMLALYARLCELEAAAQDARRRESWRAARRAFLWEHLLSWLPAYLDKLSEIAPGFYRGWSELLSAALGEEAAAAGRQEELSAHLRAAPALADPRREGFEKFLESLLAPVRCGMIVTRSDLAHAARALGLGARAGERRFALRSMFEQDAGGVLGRLAGAARARAARRARLREDFGAPGAWWERRCLDSATLLDELRESAAELDVRGG
ncbi:MAG: molecular chaperone TorD family protein [Acidobacteria bacterium]|nr:molecular chaperone TorD family protein [Acidobacteriota bacterium]